MKIEEAIAHCYENAGGCDACSQEHLQLAHWLEELVALRELMDENTQIMRRVLAKQEQIRKEY